MISEGRALEPDALRDTPEGELQGFLKLRGSGKLSERTLGLGATQLTS